MLNYIDPFGWAELIYREELTTKK